MNEYTIAPPTLHRWVVDLFRAAGSDEREAALAADHLVEANLSGHDSHGVGMVPRYVLSLLADELKLGRSARVVHEAGALITVDGARGLGQSVAHQAMQIAIERAQRHGVCVMGLKDAHHIGRVGHWAEQAVAAGMVSIHFTNVNAASALVAPWGGSQARFLTNPFTVGIPRADGPPVVLDFATSAIAGGKVRVAHNKGTKVPPGALIDADGHPTDDPGVMFASDPARRGAQLPFAEHKGYALAMVCELLGAALTGGETMRPANSTMKYAVWNNMLALVFDPARMGTGEHFEQEARGFVEWVRSARLSDAGRELGGILLPGDPERISRERRASAIPIDAETMAQLDQAAASIAGRFGRSPGPLSALGTAGTAR
ncbi:MAG TPA: malate/lactate/ureidoglycolate dehydrogenase [Quisquiliibacterium sp.]|nr:malate/lactate/ureidoglycolate dehydrogenase [Quisquiliibacterium sp.]